MPDLIGSYIAKDDGSLEPNLNDEAMKNRAEKENKKEDIKENNKNEDLKNGLTK